MGHSLFKNNRQENELPIFNKFQLDIQIRAKYIILFFEGIGDFLWIILEQRNHILVIPFNGNHSVPGLHNLRTRVF